MPAIVNTWPAELVNKNDMPEFEEYQEEINDEGGGGSGDQPQIRVVKRQASEQVAMRHRVVGGAVSTKGEISNHHHRVDLVDNLKRESYFPWIMSQCNNKYSLGPVYLTTIKTSIGEKLDNTRGSSNQVASGGGGGGGALKYSLSIYGKKLIFQNALY